MQSDLHTLLQFLLTFAQQMLLEQQMFTPFGAGLRSDGYVTSAFEAESDPSTMQEIVGILFSNLSEQARNGSIFVPQAD